MSHLATRNAARKILEEERYPVKMEMPVDRLDRVLGKLRKLSSLDVRQPVFLREDSDGLFALLPEERSDECYSSCVCWCVGDKEASAAYPARSLGMSDAVTGENAQEILDFLWGKGYTDLWEAYELTKEMHDKRMAS